MPVPLDEKHITTSPDSKKVTSIPALHPQHIQQIQFVAYVPPPVDAGDRGQYEEWLERLKFIDKDLHWLLQQPHDKFWCQAIFDESLHRLVDSYLRYATRHFDEVAWMKELPDEALDLFQEVHRLMFLTCLRMATHKESKDCFITPRVFGEILYENYIFDIPKLMDLCVLYCEGNGALLSKMVDNIFTQQPKYISDLAAAVPTVYQLCLSAKHLGICGLDPLACVRDMLPDDCEGVPLGMRAPRVRPVSPTCSCPQACQFTWYTTLVEAFDSIQQKCGIELSSDSPQKLEPTEIGPISLVEMEITDFRDLIFYLTDTGVTLSCFLDVYPAGCKTFEEAGFVHHLTVFYDHVMPELTTALRIREFDNSRERVMLKKKLLQAKKALLKVFHQILYHSCVQPILENSHVDDAVERLFLTMSTVLNERRFLSDYETHHSFQDVVEILTQTSCVVDETRLHYIQDAINAAVATYGKRKKPKGATRRGGRTSPEGASGPTENGTASSGLASVIPGVYQTQTYETVGACAKQVTGVELDSLITSVKDLLPDLGEGFIELCLEELDYSVEAVINSVLEEKLPTSLVQIDRTLPREKREDPQGMSLLDERRNVFDYDEFDLFHKDIIDTERIFQGKKNTTDTVDLDDKSELKSFRPVFDIYGSVDAENIYDKNLYDDEYDDTYDTHVVGADDADSADELTARRQFVVPRVLTESRNVVERYKSDSEEEEESLTPKNQFINDPAKLREQAAQRAMSKRGGGQQGGQGRLHDVKGKAKGQGQEDNVVKNRAWKDKNKASKGNHNRKMMADRKKSKGMF